jgi:hypothetical protein
MVEGVWMLSPSLLGRFFIGGFMGKAKVGDGGADCAREVSTSEAVFSCKGGRGGGRDGGAMFRERFFIFRAFLPGESGWL